MSLIGQRSAESSAAVRRARANRAAGRGGTTTTAARAVRTSFKGTTTEMNGHVFECYDEQSDRTPKGAKMRFKTINEDLYCCICTIIHKY